MRKQNSERQRMSEQHRKKQHRRKKSVRYRRWEEAELIFFSSLYDSYTSAHGVAQLNAHRHWLFFFFPQIDKEKNDPYFDCKWNRYTTILFRELHVHIYIGMKKQSYYRSYSCPAAIRLLSKSMNRSTLRKNRRIKWRKEREKKMRNMRHHTDSSL